MKKITFSVLFLLCVMSINTQAASYKIDNNEVENLLNYAVQKSVNTAEFNLSDVTKLQAGDKQAIVAVVLDLLLGGLAIHRVYLGGSPVLVAGYFFTFGGIFGLLPLGDFIVLLVNFGDISKYVDNDAFIMW